MPLQINRVYTKVYGSLPGDSPLLIPVPTTAGYPIQRLHILAADGFIPLSNATRKELGYHLLVCSGWRAHRWTSWNDYVVFVVKKYGSLEKGRKFLAFDSPHECGLAMDLGVGGLIPNSATIEQQKKTRLYKWLVNNAYKYGWTAYEPESWHWEYNIPLADYKAGKRLNQPLQAAIATKPLIIQNDVCEDNSCIEAPLDPDFIIHK